MFSVECKTFLHNRPFLQHILQHVAAQLNLLEYTLVPLKVLNVYRLKNVRKSHLIIQRMNFHHPIFWCS